jgi:hypothetical protein
MLVLQLGKLYTLLLLEHHDLDLLYEFRLCLVYRYELSHIQVYALEERRGRMNEFRIQQIRRRYVVDDMLEHLLS